MKTAQRHHGQKADGFQRHGLSSCIRPRNHEGSIVFPKRNVDRHGFLSVDQRMPALFDDQTARVVNYGLFAIHGPGKLPFCHKKIQPDQKFLIILDIVLFLRHCGRKLGQYPGNLRLFRKLQFSKLVVEIDDGLGLDKERSSGLGLVVNDPRKSCAVFLFYRNYISAVSHGNDGILQIRPVFRRIDNLIDLRFYGFVLSCHGAANASQLRRGVVTHLVFAQDTLIDPFRQFRLWLQQFGHRPDQGKGRKIPALHKADDSPCDSQIVADLQQLFHGQNSAL